MNTVTKTFGIITIASSLLLGHLAASHAIGDKLGDPIESAAPLVPAGHEFQVNTYTADSQDQAALAIDNDGDFIVVWYSHAQVMGLAGIFAQRYEHTGLPLGVEFQVKTGAVGSLGRPAVGMDSNGNFLIVWACWENESCDGILGQRYDHTGSPEGPEFQVNTNAVVSHGSPEVAMSHDGKFVVVWRSSGAQDGSGSGILGRRYDPTGTPEGPEFQVNTYFSGDQTYPSPAINDDGKIVVTWTSYDDQDGNGAGVFGQRYNSTGTSEGPEFQVNTYTVGHQSVPSVAIDEDGNFIVVWNGDQPESEESGIFGQRYDFTGDLIGPEFQVNASSTDAATLALTMDDNRNAWIAFAQPDQDQTGIFLRGFDPTGELIGPELHVNAFTTDYQLWPAITLNRSGQAAIAWSSWGQDGDSYGIFAQRYQANRPPSCDKAIAVPARLFSNDHAFNVIDVANVSDPDGHSAYITVDGIYQDEAVNAVGSGSTSPDGKGIGTNAAEIRAEYVAGGNGRQYQIFFTAEDHLRSACSGSVYVRAGNLKSKDKDLIIHDSTTTPTLGKKLLWPNPSRTPNPTVKVTP